MAIKKSNQSLIWRYASLGGQLFILLGLAIFGGLKLDGMVKFAQPIFVWVLPLLVIIVVLYKVIKDTATPK